MLRHITTGLLALRWLVLGTLTFGILQPLTDGRLLRRCPICVLLGFFQFFAASAVVDNAVDHAVVILQRHFSGAERIVLFRLFCYHGKGLYTIFRDSARIFCVISSYKAFTSDFRCRTGYGRRGMNTGRSADFMYVLCAAEWSFCAISYCFVHRRTSRFGSRFGSKRIFKNMVELFSQKSARKSSEIKRFRSFLWWTVQDSNL